MKKLTKTQLKKRCDVEFSRRIRETGFCYRCGSRAHIQCAHIVSRSYVATRWDFDNALPLCRACHVFFTYRPIEWKQWVNETFGNKRYEEMEARAQTAYKPNYEELYHKLRGDILIVEEEVERIL